MCQLASAGSGPVRSGNSSARPGTSVSRLLGSCIVARAILTEPSSLAGAVSDAFSSRVGQCANFPRPARRFR